MATTNFNSLSKDLYSIGKATLYFKPLGDTKYYLLGNSSEVTLSLEVTEQEIYNNECGLRTLDRTVVTELDATFAATLTQLSSLNRSLSLLGDVVDFTQASATGINEVFAGDAEAGAILVLSNQFLDDQGTLTITDGTGLVSYVQGTHFNIDWIAGAVQIIAVPAGADADVDITYDTVEVLAADGKNKIGIGSKSDNRGSLIIRGCPDVGPNVRLKLHDVQIRPAGDRSYISETDFDTIEIEGAVFRDTSQPTGFELGEELLLEIPSAV